MNPFETLRRHADEYTFKGVVLHALYNGTLNQLLRKLGRTPRRDMLLDDCVNAPAMLWLAGVLMDPPRDGDVEPMVNEMLVPLGEPLVKWVEANYAPGCRDLLIGDATAEAEQLRLTVYNDREKLLAALSGFEKTVADFESERPSLYARVQSNVANDSVSLLLRTLLIQSYVVMKATIEDYVDARIYLGCATRRIRFDKRIARFFHLTGPDRAAFMASEEAAGRSEQLGQINYGAWQQSIKAAEIDIGKRVLHDMYGFYSQIYATVMMIGDDEEAARSSTLFRRKNTYRIVKQLAHLVGGFNRVRILPEDELDDYERVRAEQFRLFEVLWTSPAAGDVTKLLSREVRLDKLTEEDTSDDDSSSEGVSPPADGGDAEKGAGGGWRTPPEGSSLSSLLGIVDEAPAASSSARAATLLPPAAAQGDAGPPSASPRAAVAEFMSSLHQEHTHLAHLVQDYFEHHPRHGEKGSRVNRGDKEKAARRRQMLFRHVYPLEILPERRKLYDVCPRLTPHTPLKEVAFILDCLDARSPFTNASRAPGFTQLRQERLFGGVPEDGRRRTSRRFLSTESLRAAQFTGRPDELFLTFLRSGSVLRMEFQNPMPLPSEPVDGFVCDACGAKRLRMGYQACTYEGVRSTNRFYDTCQGYDLCVVCAVFFFRQSFSRLARALYPAVPPLLPLNAPFRKEFHQPFGHIDAGARLVLWSAVAAATTASAEEPSVELRMLVSVCPYAGQPAAWAIGGSQQQAMVEAFAPARAGSDAEKDEDVAEWDDYLHLSLQRRGALPVPPFTWRANCRVEATAAGTPSGDASAAFADGDTCPVCLVALGGTRPVIRTTCGHWFHVECIGAVVADSGQLITREGDGEDDDDDDDDDNDEDEDEEEHDDNNDGDARAEATSAESHGAASDATGKQGVGCPMCREPNFMPSMKMDDVLARNTYTLTLRVPKSATTPANTDGGGDDDNGNARVCVGLASLISDDGHFHNYTNVVACHQFQFAVPKTLFQPPREDASLHLPYLYSYAEVAPSTKQRAHC